MITIINLDKLYIGVYDKSVINYKRILLGKSKRDARMIQWVIYAGIFGNGPLYDAGFFNANFA